MADKPDIQTHSFSTTVGPTSPYGVGTSSPLLDVTHLFVKFPWANLPEHVMTSMSQGDGDATSIAELQTQIDQSLEAIDRHADRIDALLSQIMAVRADTLV